jgi:hypothetical protein
MGPDRSLSGVAKTLAKNISLIERWSRKWDWVARATTFDDHVAWEEQKAHENELRERRKTRDRRREEEAEKDYQISRKLKEKVLKMIDYPLTSIKQADGLTTIHPAKWKLADIAPLLAAAFKLGEPAIKERPGDSSEGEMREEWIIEDHK